jgi:hypothetical protein
MILLSTVSFLVRFPVSPLMSFNAKFRQHEFTELAIFEGRILGV